MCYTDCFNTPEQVRRELTTAEILRIMDELAEAGTLELCLTGGEPLARPDFFEIYEHAIANGFLVTLFTNGTLITKPAADRFAQAPPLRIEISLHGVSPTTFEQITQGSGSYTRCWQAIDLLLDRQIPVVLKATALALNRHELLQIKRAVGRLGSVPFKLGEEIRPALNGDRQPLRYALTQNELTALHQQDADLSAEACQQRLADSSPCRSGLHRFHIDAYGMLQLCSGNRRTGYDLRQGSFRAGFYEALPTFSCPWKAQESFVPLQPVSHHA
jgi:molybdenum cofactor biosynthesis enzyme MoaA